MFEKVIRLLEAAEARSSSGDDASNVERVA
jgi:hypothetical protein